jgi:hypothetical protein
VADRPAGGEEAAVDPPPVDPPLESVPTTCFTVETTLFWVRSMDRWYTCVTTAVATEPSAAPPTVPNAPKYEPKIADVAAAIPPAVTLLMVSVSLALPVFAPVDGVAPTAATWAASREGHGVGGTDCLGPDGAA